MANIDFLVLKGMISKLFFIFEYAKVPFSLSTFDQCHKISVFYSVYKDRSILTRYGTIRHCPVFYNIAT